MTAYWINFFTRISDPDRVAAYARPRRTRRCVPPGAGSSPGEPAHTFEGGRAYRTTVIEFDSVDAAVAAYHSPAYQEALRVLGDAAERDLRIIRAAPDRRHAYTATPAGGRVICTALPLRASTATDAGRFRTATPATPPARAARRRRSPRRSAAAAGSVLIAHSTSCSARIRDHATTLRTGPPNPRRQPERSTRRRRSPAGTAARAAAPVAPAQREDPRPSPVQRRGLVEDVPARGCGTPRTRRRTSPRGCTGRPRAGRRCRRTAARCRSRCTGCPGSATFSASTRAPAAARVVGARSRAFTGPLRTWSWSSYAGDHRVAQPGVRVLADQLGVAEQREVPAGSPLPVAGPDSSRVLHLGEAERRVQPGQLHRRERRLARSPVISPTSRKRSLPIDCANSWTTEAKYRVAPGPCA